jgi:hypothetical protein
MGVHLLTCKEVEDENDGENENDWGSGGGEPSIAGIVCLKAIDQSGQHCYKTRDGWHVSKLVFGFRPWVHLLTCKEVEDEYPGKPRLFWVRHEH